MIAVILAGPHAELARKDGAAVPKLLLQLAGRPVLEQQLLWLKSCGIGAAVLCIGVGAEAVRAKFGDGSDLGISLRYVVEEVPLGTAGAVKALGPASLPDDVLILLGDAVPKGDGRRFVAFHKAHDAMATLAVHECAHVGLCDPITLGPGQAVLDFPKRPLVGGYPLALSPAWIIRRGFLQGVPDDGACDFVRDAFPAALRRGHALLGYPDNALVADLSLPQKTRR
jgi:mannose-1-phosphate guanylyltransferase/phosphomannomutase